MQPKDLDEVEESLSRLCTGRETASRRRSTPPEGVPAKEVLELQHQGKTG